MAAPKNCTGWCMFNLAIRASLLNSLLRSEKSPEPKFKKEAARTPLFIGFLGNILPFFRFLRPALRMFNGKCNKRF